MLEIQPIVSINAQTFSEAYMKVLWNIKEVGVEHKPDYNVSTKRIYLALFVKDVNSDQLSPICPLKEESLKLYKDELKEEYAEWYVSLPDDDKRKFDYCYAKQLYKFGTEDMNTLRMNLLSLRVGSRRHAAALWDNRLHIEKYEDQPCWVFYKLELLSETDLLVYITYRSWDAFGGLPFNLPAITHGIQDTIKKLNLPYNIVGFFANGYDTHIYETDQKQAFDGLKNYSPCSKCGEPTLKSQMTFNSKGLCCKSCLK
jgi:thymidylate synthase